MSIKTKLVITLVLIIFAMIDLFSIGSYCASIKDTFESIQKEEQLDYKFMRNYSADELRQVDGFVVVYETQDSYIIEPFKKEENAESIMIYNDGYMLIDKKGVALRKLKVRETSVYMH